MTDQKKAEEFADGTAEAPIPNDEGAVDSSLRMASDVSRGAHRKSAFVTFLCRIGLVRGKRLQEESSDSDLLTKEERIQLIMQALEENRLRRF